jgi:hypothetical protein
VYDHVNWGFWLFLLRRCVFWGEMAWMDSLLTFTQFCKKYNQCHYLMMFRVWNPQWMFYDFQHKIMKDNKIMIISTFIVEIKSVKIFLFLSFFFYSQNKKDEQITTIIYISRNGEPQNFHRKHNELCSIFFLKKGTL